MKTEINFFEMEREFNSAKKLAKHFGLTGGDIILKANKVVFESMGVDCLDVFDIPKQNYEKLNNEKIFDLFFVDCCDITDNKNSIRWATSKILFDRFKEWVAETQHLQMSKKPFRKILLSRFKEITCNPDKILKIRGVLLISRNNDVQDMP